MKTFNAQTTDLRTVNHYLKVSINGKPVPVKNAAHVHGLASGLKHGEVLVQGDAGDYLGVLNDGATIHVTQSAGRYLADNMTGGTVIIAGDAGFGAAQYCYGGTVVIRGNAGDFTATMNKGATIIVCGNVGDEVGTYMLKGDLIVLGDAGVNFANYLIRGTVFIRGKWVSLGHNTRQEPLTPQDMLRLQDIFTTYQIEANPADFKKIVAASEKPFYN
jgi:methylamine---glutamate N-methyltransferase subunit B